MATTATQEPGTMENHDNVLASKAQNLHLGDHVGEGEEGMPNGVGQHDYADDHEYADEAEGDGADMGQVLAAGPNGGANGDAGSVHTARNRPTMHDEPSQSYIKPIPIVTTYEPDIPDSTSVKRQSMAGSIKAPSTRRAQSMRAASVKAPTTKAESVRDVGRPPSRAQSVRAPSVRAPTNRAESIRPQSVRGYGRPESVRAPSVRPASVKPSMRQQNQQRYSNISDGAAIGDVVSPEQQREMQHSRDDSRGVSLMDNGPMDRQRPMSPFGYRPQPNILSIADDGHGSRADGRESRADGMLNRSGTVVSRANTLGRNGTLSRAANGGTVGARRGAFGRGAGASIGTQPEEVLGRDDIHSRAELSERILDDSTLRRLAGMEKKDAKRLSRVIQNEGKAEALAVKGSIKELERLSKLQKDAANTERKSQLRLSKWTSREHKARLRFLKEKERYEKIEGELRNAENDYEERRDHAAGLTAQVAEKTQELDDLRGQKAADDRERAVKLLALKNPAHS